MGRQKKKEKQEGGESKNKPSTVSSFQAEEDFPALGSSTITSTSISISTSTSTSSGNGNNINSNKSYPCFNTPSTTTIPPSTDTALPPPPPPRPAAATLLSSTVWLKHSSDTLIKTPTGIDNHAPSTISTNSASQNTVSSPEASPWCVHATKSGKIPLQVEKRRHKSVSVLRNITGDPTLLLSSLKLALGTGGKLAASEENSNTSISSNIMEIEIQGDHIKRIAKHLCMEHARLLLGGGKGALRGVSKGELSAHLPVSAKSKQLTGSGTGSARSIAKLDAKAAQLKQKNGGKCK